MPSHLPHLAAPPPRRVRDRRPRVRRPRKPVPARVAPRPRVTIKAPLLVLVLSFGAIVGCSNEENANPITQCGQGDVELLLGVEDPFEARPEHIFPIDLGLQGGHHVDISLRLTGSMDPDKTNVLLSLKDGERPLAEHRVDDWVLEYDDQVLHCEYLRARLVLMTMDNTLLAPDAVPELLDRTLRLEVRLNSSKGRVEEAFDVVLDRINLLE